MRIDWREGKIYAQPRTARVLRRIVEPINEWCRRHPPDSPEVAFILSFTLGIGLAAITAFILTRTM